MSKEEPKKTGEKGGETVGGVVLTGGSAGIGAAFITTILKHNRSIQIFNLSRTKPAESCVRHWECDLADPASLERLFPSLESELSAVEGKIILINNSGFGKYGAFPAPGWQTLREMLQVNVIAPLELTARLLPILEEKGGGVINICSTAAFQPTPFFSVYGASKAFLLHWSLSLQREYRRRGIHVLSVCPGPTATNFFRTAGFSERVNTPGKGLTAEGVARQSWTAWLKRKPLVVNGMLNRFAALLAGCMPRTWSVAVAEKVMRRYRLDQLEQGSAK